MDAGIIKSGTFRGVNAADPFAKAALEQSPVYVDLGAFSWPANLAPTLIPLGSYAAGEKITGRLQAKADVLIVLYIDPGNKRVARVFTGHGLPRGGNNGVATPTISRNISQASWARATIPV
jgi:hypothetical protein